ASGTPADSAARPTRGAVGLGAAWDCGRSRWPEGRGDADRGPLAGTQPEKRGTLARNAAPVKWWARSLRAFSSDPTRFRRIRTVFRTAGARTDTDLYGLKPGFSGLLTPPRSFIDLDPWNASWQRLCSSIWSTRPPSSRVPTPRSPAVA